MRDDELRSQTDYSAGQKEAAHRVLVEIVNILNDYRDDMLIIGGWVPDLLFPGQDHAGSIDVDLDIMAGMYGGTAESRRSQHIQGLKALKATGGNFAFEVPPVEVRIDARRPDGAFDTGRIRVDKNVEPEVRRACKDFCAWLRTEYYFPIRIPVYIKSANKVKASDGDLVCGFFSPCISRSDEPYISIATGDYKELVNKWGVDSALGTILYDISHELTHYFQWINDLNLTEIGEERQASSYAKYILFEYKDTREHP